MRSPTRCSTPAKHVLEEVTGKKPSPWLGGSQLPNDSHGLYWHRCKPKVGLPLIDIYQRMMKTQSTMILVNPAAVEEPMFDALMLGLGVRK